MSAVTQSLAKVASTVTQPTKVASMLTNQNIWQMGLLFALLSPGVVLQTPAAGQGKLSVEWMNMKTSHVSVITHALVMLVLLMIWKPNLPKSSLVAAVVLFVALSPGFVLELPSKDEHVLNTNRTSVEAVFVHTLVFMVLYGSLR